MSTGGVGEGTATFSEAHTAQNVIFGEHEVSRNAYFLPEQTLYSIIGLVGLCLFVCGLIFISVHCGANVGGEPGSILSSAYRWTAHTATKLGTDILSVGVVSLSFGLGFTMSGFAFGCSKA